MFRLRSALVVLLCAVVGATLVPAVSQARGALKTVRYHGLALRVPAGWPVFKLSRASSTCVRFDRHALYLGQPSTNQTCPPNAIGRTEAILVAPTHVAFGVRSAASRPAPSTAGADSLQEALPRAGVTVTATWSDQPGVVQHALGLASLPRPASPSATPAAAPRMTAGVRQTMSPAFSRFRGLAFDACSAPSAGVMNAWRYSPYRGVGVYVGGINSACPQPNLTASWVRGRAATGWHLLPTYVGLQAPGNSCRCAAIAYGGAAAQGRAAAADATARAAAIGIGAGNPIYYDMESYSNTASHRHAVLTFLAAWTAQLHQKGYRSGVYSSAGSGIADLVARYGSGYSEPDDLWFADWNGAANAALYFMPTFEWGSHQRVHQFRGGFNARYGGVTMNIDADYVDGATAGRGGSAAASHTPTRSTGAHSARSHRPKRKHSPRHHRRPRRRRRRR